MPTNTETAAPAALTFADVILFVAGEHSASHAEIAARFGITIEQAHDASAECGLEETETDSGLWVQCDEDYQGDEHLALADFTGDDVHAPIWPAAATVNPNPHNPTTGAEYSGGNVTTLVGAQEDAGHTTAQWAGYGQWKAAGRQVRKGEKSTRLVRVFEKKAAKGEKKGRKGVACPRVFNIDQTDAAEVAA
jgi:hypothetical protein